MSYTTSYRSYTTPYTYYTTSHTSYTAAYKTPYTASHGSHTLWAMDTDVMCFPFRKTECPVCFLNNIRLIFFLYFLQCTTLLTAT